MEEKALALLPTVLESASKLIDSATAKNQVNAAEKVLEKVIEKLSFLTKEGKIDQNMLLSILNGLRVDKDFTLARGQKKSIIVKLGDYTEKKEEDN